VAREASPYVELRLSPLLISLDCVTFHEVPEEMSVSEFIDQLKAADD
jgi:hypothetical protein